MDHLPAPYISIVVPTRDRVDLLARALDSIKTQSFQSFEVIVIDDGSSEDTRLKYTQLWEVLDSRFVLHLVGSSGSLKGLGPSFSRNTGISIAKGEVLAFCDDDDFWIADNHLDMMASAYLADLEVDMYIANQKGQSVQGTEITDWFPKMRTKFNDKPGASENGNEVGINLLCNAGGFAHLNILSVRKRIAVEAGGFWERVSYEEDRDFFWRTLDRCKKVFYNPRIIAQHNIPDPNKANNQSTQHAVVDRWLLAILVSQHIAANVKNPLIAKLANTYEGDLLRRLALHFAHLGRHGQGFAFGSRALGARFSFKWSVYLTLLGFRALLTKETR